MEEVDNQGHINYVNSMHEHYQTEITGGFPFLFIYHYYVSAASLHRGKANEMAKERVL